MITPVPLKRPRHSRPYSYTPTSLSLLCQRCDNYFCTFRALESAAMCGPCSNAADEAGVSRDCGEASGS